MVQSILLGAATCVLTFSAAGCLYLANKLYIQPSRGARLPLGQIQQNVQHEKKSTFLKSTQRPLSVPNLKSLFNGGTKIVNDENKDIEKTALSEYLPTTYVPPVKRGLPKRSTAIFKDPILKTVEEVADDSIASSAVAEKSRALSHSIIAPQPAVSNSQAASSFHSESVIEPKKDIAPDAKQGDNITATASAPQATETRNITNTHASLPALSQVSEPEAEAFLEAANAADKYLNPPALSATSEPSVQQAPVVANGIDNKVSPPALSATSEPVIHKILSSPELRESLVIKKIRGSTQGQSNATTSTIVDTRQVTAIYHGASEQSRPQNVSQEAVPMVSEDRIVTAFLNNVPQPSISVSEAVVTKQTQAATVEDEVLPTLSVSNIPMASKHRKASAAYANVSVPAPSIIQELNATLHAAAKDAEQSSAATRSMATSAYARKSSLEDGPPPPDPNAPKGLRAAVANSIKANALRPRENELCEVPAETQKVSVKKRRDATIRAAAFLPPLPWAPALQPPELHQYVDNCAAAGMLGPKAVQTRYLTPHYTVPPELQGVDTTKDEEAYDSYDEEDDYVTAQSYRSNGETTNDGATTNLFPRYNQKARLEIAEATAIVDSTRTQEDLDDEAMDPTMVAEYADEIFAYLRELEVKLLPNPYYMEDQHELQWSMRAVLMDWLVQVHARCNLLPETLFITANFVDRFLSGKVVSLSKLQLVGATALFLAAKKEEINCPTLSEIVYMVDNTYTSDELIKAERFMLDILKWELEWPGPMSFLRRISKADDYDLETRTLAKYFLEVTLMEERFIGTPCSFAAAASQCLARLMLKKGPWVSSMKPFHMRVLTASRRLTTCTIRITRTSNCTRSYACSSTVSSTLSDIMQLSLRSMQTKSSNALPPMLRSKFSEDSSCRILKQSRTETSWTMWSHHTR